MICSAIVCLWLASPGQEPLTTPVPDTSSVGLAKDLKVLESTLKQLHPGLYRYNTPDQLDRAFATLANAWSRDQSLADAYLRLSEFLGKIKCGHTYANFYNQSDRVASELFDKPNKIPFAFTWIDRKMVVTGDGSTDQKFPRGTEVLEINSQPVSEILARLMRVARADGSNDAKRVADLEVTGGSKYEAFDIFYPLYYPIKSPTYSFRIRKPTGMRIETVDAAAVSVAGRMVKLNRRLNGADEPAWELSYPNPKLAKLSMPTWVMYKSKWNWREFLKRTFDELSSRAVPNLVIDLRGNEGGDSVGDQILPYLIRKPLATENFQRFTRYRAVSEDLRPNLSTWDRSFFDWGSAAKPDSNGFYKLSRFDDLKGNVIKPAERPYLGKLYVIVGPENSSATFEFALQVKSLNLGELVGRPTGGNRRGINGGAFFFLTLPNSRIEVDVPLIAQLYPDTRPDAGILPDVHVEPTSRSIADGRDLEMERVIDLVEKSSP